MSASNMLLIATTLCVGLISGLFYAYSCSVSPGLKQLPDKEYLAAMQSINRAIQNPVFFIAFFGAPLLLLISTYLNYNKPLTTTFWLLLIAAIIYIAGTFLVTVIGNVPLNNALDTFDINRASAEMIHHQRMAFEGKWNMLNNIRTISSLMAFILVGVACLNVYRST